MGRPREHDEATRTALLAAAESLLADGTDAVSVRRVAEVAGTTTRAVYSIFGGKPALLGALYQLAFAELGDRLRTVPRTADPAADLVEAGLLFRAQALARPNLFRLAFERLIPSADLSDEDLAVSRETFAVLGTLVARALPGASPGQNARLALAFHAACHGLAAVELQGWTSELRADPETMWRHTLAALVAGLGAS